MTMPIAKHFAAIWFCLLASALVFAGGCQGAGRTAGKQPAAIGYEELAERYNRNLNELDRLWSRAVVRVRYVDDKGRTRTEQGSDSNLIIALPDHLALAVGQVGQKAIWAGSDGERYWLINMMDQPEAHVGRHNGAAIRGQSGLPLGVSPRELPRLLGLLPLPEAEQPVRVEQRDGRYIVQPPGEPTRLHIDAKSFLADRIDLLDVDGELVAFSELSQPIRVTTHGRPPGAWPLINSRIRVVAPGEDFEMTLDLEGVTDARGPGESAKDRAFGGAFDYERLIRAQGVPPERQFDLDQQRK